MNEFKASNGATVAKYEMSLEVNLGGGSEWLEPWTVKALREFFQAERDEELGRWRWPENPDYVVYPDGSADDVLVIDETVPDEPHRFSRESVSFDGPFGTAARAYFEAHPEPKPWQDAKPGEVWLLTVRGYSDQAYLRDKEWVGGNFGAAGHSIAPNDSRITAGRRIWPAPEGES